MENTKVTQIKWDAQSISYRNLVFVQKEPPRAQLETQCLYLLGGSYIIMLCNNKFYNSIISYIVRINIVSYIIITCPLYITII